MVEYRDSILYDLVAASVAASGHNSNKIGRSTEWGSKEQWKKAASSIGGPSRMTVMSESAGGIEQRFEDDTGEPVFIAEDTEAQHEGASPELAKPKERMIVKRMVRKTRKPEAGESTPPLREHTERTTMQGDKLTGEDLSTLRSALYYISERTTDRSASLSSDIQASIDNLVAATCTVGTIVDSAARDAADVAKDASISLGLSDGMVSDDSILSCTAGQTHSRVAVEHFHVAASRLEAPARLLKRECRMF